MFFQYFSFFPFDELPCQLLATLEKQTLYLISPFFVVFCSNSLPLLKSIIDKKNNNPFQDMKNVKFLEPICCTARDIFPKFSCVKI